MTRYHLELLYSDGAHPAASVMLETGAISIRRTNKPFFRTPMADNVDADVPSRQKGMASFNKSMSARRKWIVTRSVQSELVSHLIERKD